MQLQDQTATSEAASDTNNNATSQVENGTAFLELPQINSNSSEEQSTSFDVLELMRQRLPVYVVNCLLAAGYDVMEVISNMDVSENPGNTIHKIENFIERNFPDDCRYAPSSLTHSTEHSQHLVQQSTKLTPSFEFPPGHRERICSFVEEVRAKVNVRSVNESCKEKLLQLNGQKSLDTFGKNSKRKRHYDSDDMPNQTKQRIVPSEDDDSSEEVREVEVSVVTILKQVRDNIRTWVRGQKDPKLKNLIEGKHYNLQVIPDARNPKSFLVSIRCLSCSTCISLHQRNKVEKQSPFLISNWIRHWKKCDVTAITSKFQQRSLHSFLNKSLQHSCDMTEDSSAMSKQPQGSCDTASFNEGGATIQKASMFDWSRGARNRKLLEKAGSDSAQKKITEFYNILTDIEKLIESNEKLSLMLQNARNNMHDDGQPLSCKEQFSAILKQILINAEKNVGQVPTQRRHPIVLKKFSTSLFIYSGPLAYEFIQQNMPEALPSVRTIQTAIHAEYKAIDEGCFRFDELAEHLEKYGGIAAVSIGEDATRVIARVDYDPETDRCVGFVLPVDKNGLPMIDSFQATSFSAIESMFKNNSVAKYAYVYMVQSLCQNIPPFCLACIGTNNKFTAENVCLVWKYIYVECEKRNIHVLSFGADGDSHLLKAMRVTMSLMTDKSDPLLKHLPPYSLNSPAIPKEWHTWFCIDAKPVSCVQDTVHIAVKLKSRLLNPSIALRIGCYVAEGSHLRKIQTKYNKDQHGLRERDLNHQDKQNYDAVLRIVIASHLLHNIAEAQATKCYVGLMKSVIDSYLDKSLDPLERIEKLWSVVFFLRYWRQWILVNCQCSLKNNFITYNAYMCIEINAHSLITFLMTVRDQLSKDSASFLPWLLGSQSCERTFRSARSMSSTFSTMINFGMLGLLRRLHRLQIQSTI